MAKPFSYCHISESQLELTIKNNAKKIPIKCT